MELFKKEVTNVLEKVGLMVFAYDVKCFKWTNTCRSHTRNQAAWENKKRGSREKTGQKPEAIVAASFA